MLYSCPAETATLSFFAKVLASQDEPPTNRVSAYDFDIAGYCFGIKQLCKSFSIE
jgi:hypothetical protein